MTRHSATGHAQRACQTCCVDCWDQAPVVEQQWMSHQFVQELHLCGLRSSPVQPSTNSEDADEEGKDVGRCGPAVAATTRNSKWCHDAGVLGSLPFAQWGLWAPAPFGTVTLHAGLRVLRLVASFSSGCQPGSESSPPGRLSGRRPCTRSAPQREVVSGPVHTWGAHPAVSGRLKTVVLFRQPYPALTNGGVDNAVVPCGLGGNSLVTWARGLVLQQFFVIEGLKSPTAFALSAGNCNFATFASSSFGKNGTSHL